jgi:hypothetical protein
MKALGHKIIHWEATAGYSPVNFWGYYQSVLDYMGGEKAIKDFYKAYLVPGSGHCRTAGVSTGSVDWLTPLVDWVEKGIEPGAIIGTRVATPYLTARTRPICPYPQVARYMGTGSIDEAANFTCVKTIPTKVRIEPETINLKSNGVFTTFFTLPKGYHKKHHFNKKHWFELTVVCEGAPAMKVMAIKRGNGYIAKFRTQDLINITPGDEITFTAYAIFDHHGETFAIEGSDTVRVIEKEVKPPKPCKDKK